MARFVSRIPLVPLALRCAERVFSVVDRAIAYVTTFPRVRCMSCHHMFDANDPAGPGDHYVSPVMNSFCLDCNIAHFIDAPRHYE